MPSIPHDIISPIVTVIKESHKGLTPYAYNRIKGTISAFARIGPIGDSHLYLRNQ